MTRGMLTISPAIVLSQEGFKDVRYGMCDFADMLYLARGSHCPWQIRRVMDKVILAQSRTDTPGTMAALYREGKMGSYRREVK